MTSLGVQITKRIKESRERTAIQAGKLLLHICIPLMVEQFRSILCAAWVKVNFYVDITLVNFREENF